MMNKLSKEQKMFRLIKELGKTLRLFQQEAIFCEGITFTQFSILDIVAERETLKLSDLHVLLSVEKSTTTRLIEPIVKQKLIEKNNCPEDPRAIILKITEDGKKVHNAVWECISKFMKDILKGIPAGKTDDVLNSLNDFVYAFNNCCTCGCQNNKCS